MIRHFFELPQKIIRVNSRHSRADQIRNPNFESQNKSEYRRKCQSTNDERMRKAGARESREWTRKIQRTENPARSTTALRTSIGAHSRVRRL
jgi:hypothetical protein